MKKKAPLLPIIVCFLFIFQGFLHHKILFSLWSKNYSTKNLGIAEGLSPDHLLFALAGFRELISGILWVRADSFFHDGNFDAVLPIVRLATWLDPHNIDIYSVGMWHMGYNFTDTDHRSDRRYIPLALALGKEGARQNPHTYEMFFDLGWMWHHKIKDDYPNAVKWMKKACSVSDIIPARKAMLSNAYLRNGEPQKALEHYLRLEREALKEYKKRPSYGKQQRLLTVQANIENLMIRMVHQGYFPLKKNVKFAQIDPEFECKIKIPEPYVLEIEGNIRLPGQGNHLWVILKDKKYPHGKPAGQNWDYENSVSLEAPKHLTYMQDSLYLKEEKRKISPLKHKKSKSKECSKKYFYRRIDLSNDPTIYPFDSEEYVIEFYYNPRNAPAEVQNQICLSGEGLLTTASVNKNIRPGQKVLYKKIELSREQIENQ